MSSSCKTSPFWAWFGHCFDKLKLLWSLVLSFVCLGSNLSSSGRTLLHHWHIRARLSSSGLTASAGLCDHLAEFSWVVYSFGWVHQLCPWVVRLLPTACTIRFRVHFKILGWNCTHYSQLPLTDHIYLSQPTIKLQCKYLSILFT